MANYNTFTNPYNLEHYKTKKEMTSDNNYLLCHLMYKIKLISLV